MAFSSSSSSSSSSLSSSSSISSFSSSSSSEIAGTFLAFTGTGITWNRSKFVASEMAAVSYGSVQNRLSQSFGINTTSYRIGSISLYLREHQGLSQDYNVAVSLVETTAEGIPTGAIIASSIKPASDITWTGWHVFPITMEEAATPASGSLSVIFQQDGGDEDNYVAWSYANGDIPGSKALYSSDGGAIWQEQKGVVRMIRIIGIYEPFEALCNDGVIRSSIAQESVVRITNFDSPSTDGGASYDGTHNRTMTDEMSSSSGDGAEASSDQAEGDVVIQHDRLLASIVIDTSGSMGWNDRGKNKTVAVQEIVKQLQENYPGEVLFDFVSCGAGALGPSVSGGSSQYATIKLDPTTPTEVVQNNDGTTPSPSDPIIACGFSNLEEGHSYIIRSAQSGETTLLDGSGLFDNALAALVTENMQSLGSRDNPILFSIAKSGPGSEISGNPTGGELSTVADVPTGGATVIRKPTITGRHLLTSGLLSDAISGETQVVPEALDIFQVGETVDLIDVNGVSLEHAITSKDGTSLTVAPEIAKSIEEASSVSGGFVQQTSVYNPLSIDINSILELLVKDSHASRAIRFFVQTEKGGRLEWSFTAMLEWQVQNITYVDMPFDLVTYITDADGNALPQTSRIRYYIDLKPDWNAIVPEKISIEFDEPEVIAQGTDVITLPSLTGISVGDSVTLISSTGEAFGNYTVSEVNDLGSYIRILPPVLQDDFELASVEIEPSLNNEPKEKLQQQDIVFRGVDMSAAYAGRTGSNRLPNDPAQVDPATTNLNNYNQSREYWIGESFEIPTVTQLGNPLKGVATLRILPVTSDHLNTVTEENEKVASVLGNASLTDDELAEMDALNDAYSQIDELDESESSMSSSGDNEDLIVENDIVGADYILSPNESKIGEVTAFSSNARTMQISGVYNNMLRFDLNDDGSQGEEGDTSGLLSKMYTVYPAVYVKNNNEQLLARYLLTGYPVYFVSPVQIFWKPEDGKRVPFHVCCITEMAGEEAVIHYDDFRPGVYAASNETITVQFRVYHRGKYLEEAKMRVKFFDPFRKRVQMEVEPWTVVPSLEEELGGVPPDCGEKCTEHVFSSQDFYRRSRNDNGEYDYFIDKESAYAEAVYIEGYTEGGFEVDVVDGLASFVIPAPDVVTRLIIATEVVCPDNESISCVRHDSVWFKNPLDITIAMPLQANSGLSVAPFEAQVVVTCFGVPIPNNTVVTLSGSQHNKNKRGDSNKIDPNSAAGQTLTSMQTSVNQLSRQGGLYSGEASSTGVIMQAQLNALLKQSNTWPATTVKPSLSKTINGTASGFMVGPHGPVIMVSREGALFGDNESFTAEASYQPPNARGAFSTSFVHVLEWVSDVNDELVDEAFIKVTMWKNGVNVGNNPFCYTDGWHGVTLVADAPASRNALYNYFDEPEVWENLVGTSSQPAKEIQVRSSAHSAINNLPGRNRSFYRTRPLDPDTGTPIGEIDGAGEAYGWAAVNITKCGQLPPPPTPSGTGMDPDPCPYPPCEEIKILSDMKRPGGVISMKGCPDATSHGCKVPGDYGGWVYSYPRIYWTNPLEGRIWIDGKTAKAPFDITRDGATSHEIWLEILFSGEPLPLVARRHNVLNATGYPMPMPQVITDVYFLNQEWNEKGQLTKSEKMYDNSLSLSPLTPVVHISRTSSSLSHYHSCEVDDITGNGYTTGTFVENSVAPSVDQHAHEVSNFVISYAQDSSGESHSHNPMSVAISKLSPVSNRYLNICIAGKTAYDASKFPVSRTYSFSSCTSLEWFDFWEMQFSISQALVETDVETDNIGVNARVDLKHKVNGTYVAVNDGIRVNFDVKAYAPNSQSTTDPNVAAETFDMNTNSPTPYSIVEIAATAFFNGKVCAKDVKTQTYYSSLQWTPAVKPLVDYPTNDPIYIAKAISKTEEVIGSSMLYDAIVLAADRLNIYGIDNSEWKDAENIIFVLTDWCENLSERTINQVKGRLSMLAKDGRKPFLAVVLFGSPSYCDRFLANRAVSDSSGVLVQIPIGYDPTLVPDKIGSLFTLGMDAFNSGTYTGTIDIGGVESEIQSTASEGSGIFTQAYVNVNIPTGSRMTFSARYSPDQENWSSWTEPMELTGSTSITLDSGQCRYMQYRVKMVGNAEFESPRLSNITATYLKSSVDTIFLRPINIDASSDNFANEVVVTHAASIPENASVNYGTTCHNTTDAKDYAWSSKPWFSANERSVTLSRFNEPALRINNRTYVVLNGGWPTGASVEVYETKGNKHSGSLIKSSEYAANPKTGTIIFASPLDPDSRVFVDIQPDKMIRLAIKMINGSLTPIEIKQLTLMFNRTKRVRRQSDGMIIRQTIADELESSSSSSSSSESVVPILI